MKHEHFNSISDTSDDYTLKLSRVALSNDSIELNIKKGKTLVFTYLLSSRRFLQLLAGEQIAETYYSFYCYISDADYLFAYRNYDNNFKLTLEIWFRIPRNKIPELF